MSNEIDLGQVPGTEEGRMWDRQALLQAVDAAKDNSKITYVRWGGERIAAVVPVEVAEEHERQSPGVLMAPGCTPEQPLPISHEPHTTLAGGTCNGYPVNGWVLAPECRLLGHAQHELAGVIWRPSGPHAHWVGDAVAGHAAFMRESQDARADS